MRRIQENEQSQTSLSLMSVSVANGSMRDVKDLSASSSGSDDEFDPADMTKSKRSSIRNLGNRNRKLSLIQSQRYSIKSVKTGQEIIRKNEIAKEEADNVDFETAGNKEILNFYVLAKKVKKNISESIILDQLKKEKSKLRKYDTINGIFSLCLISLYVVEYEIYVSNNGKPKFSSNVFNHMLRLVMMMLSACVCVVQYYHYDMALKIEKILKLRDKRETIKTSGFLKFLVFECIVNSIICPPFVDVGFHLDQLKGRIYITIDALCFFICLLRFYNVLKVPEQYSIWTTEQSTKICKQYKFSPNISFIVKAELARRPYVSVFGSLFTTMVLFGLGVRIFEVSYTPTSGEYDDFYESFVNTFWFIVVTMVTVGYGDGYPKTHMGRFIVLWVGVVGTLLVSLMVVALTNSSTLTNGETRVFNKVEVLGLKTESQERASELIFNLFSLFVLNKRVKYIEQDDQRQHELDEIIMKKFGLLSTSRSLERRFKQAFFRYKTSTSSPEDLILDLVENNEDKFRDVYSKICKVSFIKENCAKIIENQKEIESMISDITSFQHRIAAFLVKINLNFQSNTV